MLHRYSIVHTELVISCLILPLENPAAAREDGRARESASHFNYEVGRTRLQVCIHPSNGVASLGTVLNITASLVDIHIGEVSGNHTPPPPIPVPIPIPIPIPTPLLYSSLQV